MADTIITDAIQLELDDDNCFSLGNIFSYSDGTLSLDRKSSIYQKSPLDRFYDLTDGDEITNIAYLAYNNSKEWWRIADVNNLFKPWELEIGNTLLVPDLQTSKLIN